MRRAWPLGLVVVLIGIVAVVVVWRTTGQPDPPPEPTGPGTFRLQPDFMPDGGHRAPYQLTFRGRTVRASFGGVDEVDGAKVARLTLSSGEQGPSRQVSLRPGARTDLGEVSVKVLDLYDASSDADDFVDVQLLPD